MRLLRQASHTILTRWAGVAFEGLEATEAGTGLGYRGGEFLSVQEIKAAVFRGHGTTRIAFLGEVAYPARHENNYMDIRQRFNNCFVVDEGSANRALKMPAILYSFVPRLYHEKLPDNSVLCLEFVRQCYAVIVVGASRIGTTPRFGPRSATGNSGSNSSSSQETLRAARCEN